MNLVAHNTVYKFILPRLFFNFDFRKSSIRDFGFLGKWAWPLFGGACLLFACLFLAMPSGQLGNLIYPQANQFQGLLPSKTFPESVLIP